VIWVMQVEKLGEVICGADVSCEVICGVCKL